MPAARVLFSGKVQGVFFRANTKQRADQLGLTGWVRNLSDGRVEAHIEGEEDNILELIEWCVGSQPYAVVAGKEVKWVKGEGFPSFEIRH